MIHKALLLFTLPSLSFRFVSWPSFATPNIMAPSKTTEGSNQLTEAFGKELSLASRSVHADDYMNSHRAVAPPMHVSTTFRYSRNPNELQPHFNVDVSDN
jgi:hypothetical protein